MTFPMGSLSHCFFSTVLALFSKPLTPARVQCIHLADGKNTTPCLIGTSRLQTCLVPCNHALQLALQKGNKPPRRAPWPVHRCRSALQHAPAARRPHQGSSGRGLAALQTSLNLITRHTRHLSASSSCTPRSVAGDAHLALRIVTLLWHWLVPRDRAGCLAIDPPVNYSSSRLQLCRLI